MSTPLKRIKRVGNCILFTTAILLPVEMARVSALLTFIVPMLLVGVVEYIATGENECTENCANTIENCGKQYVEEMAIKMDVKDCLGRIN